MKKKINWEIRETALCVQRKNIKIIIFRENNVHKRDELISKWRLTDYFVWLETFFKLFGKWNLFLLMNLLIILQDL